MLKKIIPLLMLLLGSAGFARAPKHTNFHQYSNHTGSYKASSKQANGVPRDSHGHIKRSSKSRHQFMKSHPCPSLGKTSDPCRGYLVDHIYPLNRGSSDNAMADY